MKKMKYIVTFDNGEVRNNVYANGLIDAYCISHPVPGSGIRIISIEDEYSNVYTDFSFSYKTKNHATTITTQSKRPEQAISYTCK